MKKAEDGLARVEMFSAGSDPDTPDFACTFDMDRRIARRALDRYENNGSFRCASLGGNSVIPTFSRMPGCTVAGASQSSEMSVLLKRPQRENYDTAT